MDFINRSLCTYHSATKFVTDCWSVVRGLLVIVYQLVLWFSTFVTDCLNMVRGLPVIVYMSLDCSTQLAQYSDV